jgi:uncharacterized protein (TIGR02246 family)
MSPDLTAGEQAALENIVARLEASWNAMDAAGFAAAFGGDADFVNIHGEHFQSRPMIAAGHAAIFRTVYVGSTTRFTLETARLLHAEVALLHVHAVLEVPQGPLPVDTAPASPWS